VANDKHTKIPVSGLDSLISNFDFGSGAKSCSFRTINLSPQAAIFGARPASFTAAISTDCALHFTHPWRRGKPRERDHRIQLA
jgi:hypothetical protein